MKLNNIYFFITFLLLSFQISASETEKKMISHKVERGESLMTISYQYYGTHQKWQRILDANPDIDAMNVAVGSMLNVPNALPLITKVKVERKAPTPVKKPVIKKVIKTAIKPVIKRSSRKERAVANFNRTKANEKALEEKYKEAVAVKLWKKEKKEILWELKQKTEKLSEYKKKVKVLENKIIPLTPSVLSYSEDQVLRERNRILMQKIWVEKNRDFQECKVQYANYQNRDQKIHDFIGYVNATYGDENVLIESSENKIILNIPGSTVYGVSNPKINKKSYKELNALADHLRELPIENIHLTGISQYSRVNNGNGGTMAGDSFMLKQALTLEQYLVDDQGISPTLLTAGSHGQIQPDGQKPQKKFFIEISLEEVKKNTKNKREIASVIEEDQSLRQISTQILEKLHEPKYSKVKIKDNALEIHLARKYFFAANSSQLTPYGEKKVNSILEMFSLVNDANYQIIWSAGKFEKDRSKNMSRGIASLASIKNHANSKYSWTKDRIEIAYQGRHKAETEAYTPREDIHNQSIIFRLVPRSINLNILGEPVDEN